MQYPVFPHNISNYIVCILRNLDGYPAFMMIVCVWAQALSQDQLWKHYTEMLGNLLVVCDITAVSSWEELQAFLAAFSAVQPGKCPSTVTIPYLDHYKCFTGCKAAIMAHITLYR